MNTLIDKYMSEFDEYTKKPSKKLAISIRASLLEISKFCAVQRVQFLQESKNMPTKPRSKKLVPLTPPEPEPVKVETVQPEPEPVKSVEKPDNLEPVKLSESPKKRTPSKRKTKV
jgi:hypothetical protein